MKEKTLAEIYNCEAVTGSSLSALEQWYNNVISKTEKELSTFDILRCFRQKVFLKSAIKGLLLSLKEDPLTGEFYDGEMLEYLKRLDSSSVIKHKEEISSIITQASKKVNMMSAGDKDNLMIIIDNVKQYINKISQGM